MKKRAITRSTRRRIGAVALGLGLVFGAGACGAEEPTNAFDVTFDEEFFEDLDIEAELEAWEEFQASGEAQEILDSFNPDS